VLAWIISLFNWRATTSAILLDRTDPGFSISVTDGTRYSFSGEGLWGANSLLNWSDSHGVKVEPVVRQLMESKPDYQPSKAGRVVSIVFALLALLGAGWPLTQITVDAMPQPEPEFRKGSFDSQTEFGQAPPEPEKPIAPPANQKPTVSSPPVKVTPEMLAREQHIISQIQEVRDELNTLKSQIGTVSNPNPVAIEKSQQAMKRLQELQKQFDAVRAGKIPEEQPRDSKTP
ncbi:MAG: hypothetical protein KDA74_19060, partial [Planctomycetaceae bacterium]|nr:hypothetical protein [Planctomycetaceae bacterium]